MITNLVRPVLHGVASLVFPPTGRHRQMQPLLLPDAPVTPVGAKGTVLGERELLAGWAEPELAPGAVVRQRFVDCPLCDQVEAGAVTSDGTWRCGSCGTHVLYGGA